MSETNGDTLKASHLIEAILLTSSRPVTVGALSSATGLPEAEVESALYDLARRYAPVTSTPVAAPRSTT